MAPLRALLPLVAVVVSQIPAPFGVGMTMCSEERQRVQKTAPGSICLHSEELTAVDHYLLPAVSQKPSRMRTAAPLFARKKKKSTAQLPQE
jgi:hypothetical protein